MADIKKPENSKDGLALIVGGLFILALVFAAYNYFNKTSTKEDIKKIQEETVFQKDNNNKSDNKKQDDNSKSETKGDLNGNGASTSNPEAAVNNSATTSTTGTWVANDYKTGDIKAGSYTVKSGDTLWEIAEAAYGNGADWHKILDANKSSIGFLPNGSQALIKPGQVLVLP